MFSELSVVVRVFRRASEALGVERQFSFVVVDSVWFLCLVCLLVMRGLRMSRLYRTSVLVLLFVGNCQQCGSTSASVLVG